MLSHLSLGLRLRALGRPTLALGLAIGALALVQPIVRGIPGELAVLVVLVLGVGLAAGRVAEVLGLPRLTGHLLAGVGLSPGVAALAGTPGLFMDATQARGLGMVNDLAVGVIALMAGSEIQARWLRAHGRGVVTIVGALLVVVPGVTGLLFLMPWLIPGAPAFPFLLQAQAEGANLWVVGALAAVVLVANGPTVVVGVIRELGSRGPLAQTLLATSVVLDAVVVVAVTMLLAVLDSAAGAGMAQAFAGVSLGLVGSLVIGLAIGWGLRRYTEEWPGHLVWVVLGAALAVATLGVHIGLKPLFCLMAAGVAFGNLGHRDRDPVPAHRRLHQALGQLGTPVFAVFFVVAGLSVQIAPLIASWLLVVTLLVVRDLGIFTATRWGARLAGSPPAVRRNLWAGMTTQAGVTLALAGLIGHHHPGWGAALATVLVALVTVHELWCPLVLARALRREG